MNGQKVYNANVRLAGLTILVINWNKGIYLLKMGDVNGNNITVKIDVK